MLPSRLFSETKRKRDSLDGCLFRTQNKGLFLYYRAKRSGPRHGEAKGCLLPLALASASFVDVLLSSALRQSRLEVKGGRPQEVRGSRSAIVIRPKKGQAGRAPPIRLSLLRDVEIDKGGQ